MYAAGPAADRSAAAAVGEAVRNVICASYVELALLLAS